MRPLVKSLLATSIAALIGGRIFADQIGDGASQTVDVGAWLVFIASAIVIYRTASSPEKCSDEVFKKIWIACAVAWPLFITIGYNGSLYLAKRAVLSRIDNAVVQENLQKRFRAQYGREATPEEIDLLRNQLSNYIDQAQGPPGTKARQNGAVRDQWLWGPLWISGICYFVLRKRKGSTSLLIKMKSVLHENSKQPENPTTFKCAQCFETVHYGMRFCPRCGISTSSFDKI